MTDKRKAPIRQIKLNVTTYDGETIHPTLVNFFYGANGTGKSTIARVLDPTYPALGKPSDVVWAPGKTADDYDVLVFDQDFIDHNFHTYGNVDGVFTIGEENIQIQAEIDAKTAERAELQRLCDQNKVIRDEELANQQKLTSRFNDACWDHTKAIRGIFLEPLKKIRNKAAFLTQVLAHDPVPYDVDELKGLYETAFDPHATAYPLFEIPEPNPELKGLPGFALLGEKITSSSDTDFTRFINAIGATDWVRLGHQQFADTPGHKCPYCQRKLPAGFEQQITAAFDDQYHQDIQHLQEFQAEYAERMESLVEMLRANTKDTLPKLMLKVYRAKVALLAKVVDNNIRLIADKVKEPSTPIALDDTDTLITEIAALAKKFNKQIGNNNVIVAAQQDKQNECVEQIWELAAFELQHDIAQFHEQMQQIDEHLEELNALIAKTDSKVKALTAEIGELNHRTTTTAPAIDAINKLLTGAGFQGFRLREKTGSPNVYEVVREDGTVATRLSEGERNFIAFLYFYQLVKGSRTPGGTNRDKIVIIDDPVSSMDTKALTIVASLVHEFVEVTLDNVRIGKTKADSGDAYIKQVFILTHNGAFHTVCSQDLMSRYGAVSSYLVSKKDNRSKIELCIEPKTGEPTEFENYSPVLHDYAELWNELKEADSPIEVMNLMRRILAYYFLQLPGHRGNIQEVLEKNRDKFITKKANGRPDETLYRLAESMLAYIGSNPVAAMKNHKIGAHDDLGTYQQVFKQIFEALGQDQHYHHMMMIGGE